VLLCAVALGGCSTVRGWFSGDDDEAEPTELTEITPTASVSELWTVDVGEGEGLLGVRQRPVVADGKVYAAAIEGGVHAYDLQTGRPLWTHESELRLSGGPGVGDGLVVVGSLDGVVLALDAATGAEKWRAEVNNEVIAAPTVGLGMVFVRSNDGRVTAFDQATGERRWFWTREVPPLSVRGNDAVVLGPGYVFVGNDDGTVVALSAQDGRPLWEQVVGPQEGRSELDRMADIDGTPVLEGTALYASSYKNTTMAIDAPTGRPMWAADHGGAGRVAIATDRLVVSDPDGVVWGLDKAGGSALWSQPGLKRRKLSAPAIHGDYAVVGDLEGVVHWLDLGDGAFAARAEVGDAVRATPVVADGILLVQDIEGELTAFRLGGAQP
jgi:outer membrane protein assembly factor BamB